MNVLTKIHHRLIPSHQELGYIPYLSLAYLAIFFINIYFKPVSGMPLVAVIVSTLIFLGFYFRGFWVTGRQLVMCIGAIFAVGMAMAYVNVGASVFFVYAAVFCASFSTKKAALSGLLVVISAIGVFAALTQQSSYFWIPATLFSFIIGLMTVHQAEVDRKNRVIKLSQQQIQTLAKTAERERIGRDLHDILGHSLSVITLKSELASKMIDKGVDLEKVRAEIKAVETLSRETLAQVRGAVTGYNQATIDTELLQARVATQAANIELITQVTTQKIPHNIEPQLALIMREAMTNVVRHANTDKAWVILDSRDDVIELSIKDQGEMISDKENSGLNNMRQRITKLGGTMTITRAPTCLHFCVPISPAEDV